MMIGQEQISVDVIDQDYRSTLKGDFSAISRDAIRRLSLGQGIDQILDSLFESLQSIIPYDRMSIALIEEEGSTLTARWVRSHVESKYIPRNFAAPLSASLNEIFRSGKPRIIKDLILYFEMHPDSVPTSLILKDGMRSSLTCPLVANNARVGLVFFSSTKKNTYRDEAIPLFAEIANLISMIVEQARLRIFFEQNLFRVQTLRTVLHDLKNPLSMIQGMLEVSSEESWFQDLPNDAKSCMEVISRNAKFMQDLLSDLSILAVDPQLGLQLQPQEVNLLQVCREWALTGQVLAKRKKISFETDFDQSLLTTGEMDQNRIRQVVENLFSNAVKFSFPKSTIRLEARLSQGELHVAVIDQGPGIPFEERSKLFHEFGRTSVQPTGGESSTGLGLAIAKRIVDHHHGQIGVESEVGRGSKFWFSIPVLGH